MYRNQCSDTGDYSLSSPFHFLVNPNGSHNRRGASRSVRLMALLGLLFQPWVDSLGNIYVVVSCVCPHNYK